MTIQTKTLRIAATAIVSAVLLAGPVLLVHAADTSNPTGCPGGSCAVINPLNVGSFPDLINAVLKAALIIAVPIIILFIVYSGFLFVTARGDTAKLATARLNFFYVVIGSIVLLGAMAIASIIASTIRSFGVPV